MKNKTNALFMSGLLAVTFLDIVPIRCGDGSTRPRPLPPPENTDPDDVGEGTDETDEP